MDGAYDTRRCHTAIIGRQATPIIPIRKNGRPWKQDCPAAIARNETLRATRHYGRALWKRWTGYHARSRIEGNLSWFANKPLPGNGCAAPRHSVNASPQEIRTARLPQIQIRIALMKRFSALGTAEIVRVD